MQWQKLRNATLVVPLCVILDILAGWQHNALSSGPYLPATGHADACIVLGYALCRDGTPSRPLRERVEGAVHLNDQVCNLQYMPWITHDWELLYTPPPSPDSLSRGRVRYLVFSGGHPGGGIRGQSEAAAMEAYAQTISSHIQPERWIMEDKSTSTRENALFSLKFAEDHEWKDVVVATNPFHQLRSRLVFQCACRELFPPEQQPKVWLARVGMERSRGAQLLYEPLLKQYNFFRELLALAWYWWNDWLC